MSARRPRVDWRGWRSDVARRLDRAVIVGAFGLTVFSVALMHIEHANVDPALVAARSLYWLATVTVTVLALATSMVAVARGARAWMAYALAGVVIVTAAAAADLAFAPYAWKVGTASRHLPATVVAHLTIMSMLLAPAAVFYVCASNAAHQARLLRSLDIERRGRDGASGPATAADRAGDDRPRSGVDGNAARAAAAGARGRRKRRSCWAR